MASYGYQFGAALKNSKIKLVGAHDAVYEYTDLPTAVAAANPDDLILLEPGTYTLTTKLSITKPLRIVGLGGAATKGVYINSTYATGPAIDVEMTAQSAEAHLYFENIRFKYSVADKDLFDVNNTTVGQDMVITFQNCDLVANSTASTGKALDVSHATAGKSIKLYVSGRQHECGVVNFTAKNASDLVKMIGMICKEDGSATAVITSADNLAAGVEFHYCQFTSTKALSGGHSTQTVLSVYSHDRAGVAATGDFTGSHTETLIGS
jgi:hypothetical protein